ncbi:MAG TPA: DUF2269 family protein [Acidimicrobiia bacterium]|nr:DUF2269 family protein [Acidimicrobiia bacterium]
MYRWWKLIHLVGVVGFMAAHGTSIASTLLLRSIRHPQRIAGILQLSAATVGAFYAFTLILLIGGIGAGFDGSWWGQGWIWVSLVLLVALGVLMFPMARGYFRRVRLIIDLMESGTIVSPQDFARVLASGKPLLIAGTGSVTIFLILYLMVMKPF